MVVDDVTIALEANSILGEQIKEIIEAKTELGRTKSKKTSSNKLEMKSKKISSAEKKKSIFGSARSKSKKKAKKETTEAVEQPPVLLEPEGTPKERRRRTENKEEEEEEERTGLEPAGQGDSQPPSPSPSLSPSPSDSSSSTVIIINNPSTPKRKKKNPFEAASFDEKKLSSRKSPSKHRKRKKRSKSSSVRVVECGEDSSGSEEDFCGDFMMEAVDDAKNDYVCLTESDIIAEQAREIDDVSDILSINPSVAIALLKHFKWNKDKLLTSYFDHPSKVLKDSGINLSEDSMLEKKAEGEGEEEAMECSICGEECTSLDSHSIKPCYHRFCNICWKQYLTMKITEGQAAYINCPHYKCLSLVQEATVKQMVDEGIYRKYCMFLMKSFVEDNENVKWCPAPNCGNAVTSDMITQRKTVSCICSYRFCFQCSEEAHLPATCEQLKLWKKKCQDESETQNWIAANTQECPKCSLPTEKNGGCNHMTCRQCKYEYCWICLKDWKGHNDYYTCNRYQKKEEKAAKTKKGSKKERELQRIEMRRALEKYLHYYSRYMNHARSSELERIRDKAIRKMHEMQETEATSAEVLFIKLATDRLIECRSVLKYTYVLHYYMKDSPQKDLFEYLQEDLEKTAELLSEALEHPMKNKMQVVNLTVLADTRLNNLLDAVDNSDPA